MYVFIIPYCLALCGSRLCLFTTVHSFHSVIKRLPPSKAMTTEKVTYNRRLGKWVVRQREADERMEQTDEEEGEKELEEWRKLEKLEDQVLNMKKDDTGRQDPLTVGKKEETINRGVPLRGQRTIQRFQEPVPMAAQVFNQTCPSTQSTVALPAWQFSGIGGFDRPSQLYDANDFVQRVQMMDPGVPVQTWTDVVPQGTPAHR